MSTVALFMTTFTARNYADEKPCALFICSV